MFVLLTKYTPSEKTQYLKKLKKLTILPEYLTNKFVCFSTPVPPMSFKKMINPEKRRQSVQTVVYSTLPTPSLGVAAANSWLNVVDMLMMI